MASPRPRLYYHYNLDLLLVIRLNIKLTRFTCWILFKSHSWLFFFGLDFQTENDLRTQNHLSSFSFTLLLKTKHWETLILRLWMCLFLEKILIFTTLDSRWFHTYFIISHTIDVLCRVSYGCPFFLFGMLKKNGDLQKLLFFAKIHSTSLYVFFPKGTNHFVFL